MTGSDTSPSIGDAAGGAADGSGSRRSRRAADGPVDAVPEPLRERESQARARNREALRAFRALAESQGGHDDGARVEMPTRRQLRLQQAQARAGSSATTGSSESLPDDPRGRPGAGDDSAGSAGAARRPVGEPLPGGRRDRRRQHTAPTAAVGPRPDPTTSDAPQERRIEDMSIEEALAARQAIAEDARAHAAALNASGKDDPFTVDLEVLAQQKALAERAAVLNSRARRIQELSEQNQQRTPASNDPTTAHNLSIVAPPEFVRAPGGAQAVLRAPSTSHVPVVLPRPKQAPAASATASEEGGRTQGDAVASDASADTEPIRARSAFGLEPLDAMTAGLGRLRRVRYIQYSLLGVGAAALSTGIIMTVSSLNG